MECDRSVPNNSYDAIQIVFIKNFSCQPKIDCATVREKH